MRAVKALARQRICTVSSEPSLVAIAICTKISCAGSCYNLKITDDQDDIRIGLDILNHYGSVYK